MISIIVPTYNGSKKIGHCLDALICQKYEGEYEIIVVNDGSKDDTSQVVSRYPKARLVEQANQGPAAARNHGARLAGGEIILFTDDDCVPESDWIAEMVRPFQEEGIVGVKGRYLTRQKEIAARFVQLEYEDKYDYMQSHPYIDFIDTYSAAFKKDVFWEAGGYDCRFPVACAEDVDLSFRLSQKGHRMVYNPQAKVYHTHPNRVWDYLQKKRKFAYWRMEAIRKTPSKAMKDSHTPQTMKLQLAFPPSVFLTLAGCVVLPEMFYLLALLLLLFGLTSIPFTLKALQKDAGVGLCSPFLLFLRASAQFLGISSWMLAFIIMRKKRNVE